VTSAHSSKKEAGVARIPAGKYIVRSNYNKFKKLTPFEIKPGEVTKVNIVFGETGTVEITASETDGGRWVRVSNYISQDDDGKLGRSVTSAHSSKKEAGVAKIPAGKYIIRSSYNKFKKLTPFEVKPGEVTKIHLTFSQFSIEAKCPDMSQKVNYEIYASNGRLVYEKETKCSDLSRVTLDNDNYTIEAKIDSGSSEAKFTVGGDHPNRMMMDLTNLDHEEEKKELR
ncbi:MAG: hypothetical protein U9R27_12390, partial [Campylobacterota bacterium]|nr:hypothetical protein [Campylobacterota bacterium]